MSELSVAHATFTIERKYSASPERTFSAFADPAKKRRWFVDGKGFETKAFEMDFRVGGVEKTSFLASAGPEPIRGKTFANDTTYHDIVENRRIVLAYTMSIGGKRISTSLSTYEFQPDGTGTKLIYTDQAAYFEGSDGAKMREGGWRELLESLDQELRNHA